MASPRLRATIRRLRGRVRRARDLEVYAFWRRRPVRADTVLYESFAGNGLLCNPEALFRALLAAPDMRHLRHVLVLADFDRYAGIVKEFSGYRNVRFVRYRSPGYYAALATSKYLVNNATFLPQFSKRPDQVYLNTWHGTPLKSMGYDVPAGGPDTRNVIRNFVHADYLLSGSEFMTRQMYQNAYKLTGIFRGRILQEGFPRIDRQSMSPDEAAALKADLRRRGMAVDDRQIVLYAPTWKGRSFYRPRNDAEELRDRVAELTERLDTDRYQVLLKVHQQAYRFAAERADLADILVPNDVPTNAVLGVSDVLVSDYSSIFFDFLATGRPVLFFVPDLAEYSGYRGMYLPPDRWPGPVTDSVDELAGYLNDLGTGTVNDVRVSHAERYSACVSEYCPRDDGHATERVIDVVFRGRAAGHDLRSVHDDGRQNILLYLGGMRTNGITSSALSLLDNIDHSRFDVSVVYDYQKRTADRTKNEAAINPNVRLFPYIGRMNGSRWHTFGRRALLHRGVGARVDLATHRRLFRDEFRRVFGSCRFDHIIEFSGYGPFWTLLMLAGEATTHSIWLHNDMAADRMREVDGRRPFEAALGAVFSTYPQFDRLVSVCEPLTGLNRRKLRAVAGDARFVSAPNTLNHRRILRLADEDLLAEPTPEADEAVPSPDEQADEPAPPDEQAPEAQAVASMDPRRATRRGATEERRAARRELLTRILRPAEPVTTFMTVARLSPEKAQARLVRAFATVHAERPDTRLVIVGGGPLRGQLDALTAELGLTDAVIMAGRQHNPYALLRAADCFVMPSDYEGQGIAILEARVLGLPVVSTDFEVVRGALPEGTGLVVPRSVEGLVEGMREFLRGNVPNPEFDYVTYNKDAVRQFYDAIGVEPAQERVVNEANAGGR